MKKSLLKASLICLEAILLCGLSSFKSPERVNSQQSCQTVTISNDTITTSDREESRYIKEVVFENDQKQCTCTLFVSENSGNWRLGIKSSCSCELRATYVYTKYYIKDDEFKEETIGPLTVDIGSVEKPALDQGKIGESVCFPVSIDAHIK